jgi:hypothetical protein
LNHLILSGSGSDVIEVTWQRTHNPSEAVLEFSGANLIGFAGFATPGLARSQDLLMLNSTNQLVDYAFSPERAGQPPIVNADWTFPEGPRAEALAGFEFKSGLFGIHLSRHALVGLSNGDVFDLYTTSAQSSWSSLYLGNF